MKTTRDISVPYLFTTSITGQSSNRGALVNSTNKASITVQDDDGNRVSNAVVTITVTRPDTHTATVMSLAVPLKGNGVYEVLLPKGAFPKALSNYQINWSIVRGQEEYYPTDYVTAWVR